MKELFYETQGSNTYLVYEVGADELIDSMSLGMITNNKIAGLTQTIYTQMDEKKYIKFNVSAKVSVSQFFSGPVNKKRLLGVVSGVVNAMLAAEDYMLDPASILLDLNYIFTDVSSCTTDLICLPLQEHREKTVDLKNFFRNIMFSTQFDQTENCDYIARIINYLNGTPAFSLYDFKQLIDELLGNSNQMLNTNFEMNRNVVPNKNEENQDKPIVTQNRVMPSQQKNVVSQQQQQRIPQPQTFQNKPNVPVQNGGMPNPYGNGMSTHNVNAPIQSGSISNNEKEISFFYLMQHYNKENAAAYKNQKEAKKKAASMAKGKGIMPQNGVPQIPQQNVGYSAQAHTGIPQQGMPIGDVGKAQQVSVGGQVGAPQQGYPIGQQGMPQQGRPTSQSIQGFVVQGQVPVNQFGQPAVPQGQNKKGNGKAGTVGKKAVPQSQVPANQFPRPVAPQGQVNQFGQQQPGYGVPGQVQENQFGRPVVPQRQVMNHPASQQSTFGQHQVPHGQSMNFGETTILGQSAIGETSVLTAGANMQQMIAPHLIRTKIQEKISLNKPIFRIGKERSYVDYAISDNGAISRSHANIITKNGEFFIVDTNSTNHTYVNGTMLQSNVETQIKHGDMIRLANEDFEFKLY